ncbi:phosphotransferase [Plantibacter sp. VKM Ac-2880]|uniref:phosphotransferase n=1 Tax=Plantibacter sp. VKM Ac-2880 TaxID=2783827 RepID=UPI00188EC459|nr:phosphotransferase [Plantibacter sp. VKM Ac-2880]MBF4568722.1 phosphotransferase [Plantibacter sp. VKM Ac-2880]
MARSHLTLAALATSAVADLQVRGSGAHTAGGEGNYDAARLVTGDGRELIVRIPTSQQAETEQSADLIALRALTPGIRSRLPFDAPTVVGQLPVDGTRAVVLDFVAGTHLDPTALSSDEVLADSLGAAIAAIHSLPTSFVAEAGLPLLSTELIRADAHRIVSRAAETRLLPTAVRERWQAAVEDNSLWQFQPTVIHGALAADRILVIQQDGHGLVNGVLDWGSLRVGDPALDLHWIATLGATGEQTLSTYAVSCSRGPDRFVTLRARLYAELEIARWLLHGRDSHDETIVEDAVAMLDGLVDRVLGDVTDPLGTTNGPVLAVDEVEDMLDRTPLGSSSPGIAMQTDTYDRSELERALGRDPGTAGTDEDEDPSAEDANATDQIDTSSFELWDAASTPKDRSHSDRSSSSE